MHRTKQSFTDRKERGCGPDDGGRDRDFGPCGPIWGKGRNWLNTGSWPHKSPRPCASRPYPGLLVCRGGGQIPPQSVLLPVAGLMSKDGRRRYTKSQASLLTALLSSSLKGWLSNSSGSLSDGASADRSRICMGAVGNFKEQIKGMCCEITAF